MPRAKIAITVDEDALTEIDRLVKDGVFPNRSKAFEVAMQERLARVRRTRLAREVAKLDPAEERAMAEERFTGEVEWPEY
ncbi:MAG TPA: ribbon-helix-helix domain-containing protein [Thermoanaerobaculia bacterium]|nr:ribbon-helix-helix domain-containing protein [Thermoanaerobaculia bacterium]